MARTGFGIWWGTMPEASSGRGRRCRTQTMCSSCGQSFWRKGSPPGCSCLSCLEKLALQLQAEEKLLEDAHQRREDDHDEREAEEHEREHQIEPDALIRLCGVIGQV